MKKIGLTFAGHKLGPFENRSEILPALQTLIGSSDKEALRQMEVELVTQRQHGMDSTVESRISGWIADRLTALGN